MAINDDYNNYLKEIVGTLTADTSLMKLQHAELDKLFINFGFTNEQIAEIKAKTFIAETQYIDQYSTEGAIALIKAQQQERLIDAQILKIEAEIEGINADIALTDKKGDLIDAQIAETNAKIALINAQKDQAIEQVKLTSAQAGLVARQTTGYGDNLIVKAGEFQGGLASFAVNANSDSAQSAINEFLATISQMKSRA